MFTSALAYAAPLVGAWLSDELWGRYATIMRFGGVSPSACGSSWPRPPASLPWTVVALVFVGLGTGIKPWCRVRCGSNRRRGRRRERGDAAVLRRVLRVHQPRLGFLVPPRPGHAGHFWLRRGVRRARRPPRGGPRRFYWRAAQVHDASAARGRCRRAGGHLARVPGIAGRRRPGAAVDRGGDGSFACVLDALRPAREYLGRPGVGDEEL